MTNDRQSDRNSNEGEREVLVLYRALTPAVQVALRAFLSAYVQSTAATSNQSG